MGEAAGGVAVVVLAILGLANVAPQTLVSVAVIVVGAALLMQAAVQSAEFARMVAATETGEVAVADLTGGVTVEYLAGSAGIVLGILALLGIASMTLLAVALIVFGAVMLINCGVTSHATSYRVGGSAVEGAMQAMARQATMAVAGARALIGVAAIVLGILALVNIRPEILVLVGLLIIGGALLLAGSAVAGPAAVAFRR
jgi:hypothetical protein